MSDAIVCENLTKNYGLRTVVNQLSLRVPENTVFGFLGPNGAGKSTSMKLLTGQIKPTYGKAWVAGLDVTTQLDESHRHIGYLSELPNFYGWMRGQELLEFVGEIFGMNPVERRNRAKELLQLVGLGDAGRRKVATYSGGMRQRLGIAQALVNHPRVVFLDEPVSALDPLGRRDVLTLLDHIRQEATVFMSSHVLADVDRVCEQVAILNYGQLVIAGATAEIKERYATPSLQIQLDNSAEELDKLKIKLATLPFVKKVETQEANALYLEVSDAKAERELGQIVPRLVSELNLTLRGYYPAVPNLEDIFVKLVAGANR